MKRLTLMFYLLCKRQLKQVILTILLIAMPIAGLIFHILPAMQEGGIPCVALYASPGNEAGQDTIKLLLAKNEGIRFYQCNSVKELEESVMSKDAECGYIFDDRIKENILSSRLEDNITVVTNGANMVTGTTNEIVFSAVLSSITKDISVKYMQDHRFFPVNMWDLAVAHFNEKFDTIYVDGSSLQLRFKTLQVAPDGSYTTNTMEAKAMSFPVRGMMAALIFIACVLGAAKWISDKESGLFAPMGQTLVNASRPLYILVPALMFGLSGLLTLALSGNFNSLSRELGAMAVYLLINVAVGTLLTLTVKRSQTIIALLPVAILCCLLLCPVFLDLSGYIPAVKVLNKFLPPYYYLRFF